MAFYSYRGDADECSWSPYAVSYNQDYGVASQFSSAYYVGERNLVEYAYYEGDYSASAFSEPINYTSSYDYSDYCVNSSETNYGEPKYLRYDPPPHYQGYFPPETKFTVSYSNVELTQPEFDEYDPTPYDGGYDQTMTYDKPLPPSDLTCYPRSLPQSDAVPLENFSFDSIPSPYGRDDPLPTKSSNGSKSPDPETESGGSREDNGEIVGSNGKDSGKDDEIVAPNGNYSSYEDENRFGNGGGDDFGNVTQIPYGSGLEAMDICESLFGYWPCVEKKEREQRIKCQNCVQIRRKDPWETTADYIFRSAVPYDYDNYHHHQSPYQKFLGCSKLGKLSV